MLNDYIPIAILFYSSLSDEDLASIYDKLKDEKEIFDLLSKIFFNLENNLKFHISEKRTNCLKYLNKIKNELMFTLGGIKSSHFIL